MFRSGVVNFTAYDEDQLPCTWYQKTRFDNASIWQCPSLWAAVWLSEQRQMSKRLWDACCSGWSQSSEPNMSL